MPAISRLCSAEAVTRYRPTESGCRAGLGSTSNGQRNSFHAPITVMSEVTPMIGLDIGRTMRQKIWNGPAPSIFAASNTSFGSASKNRVTSSTLNALAAPGSHTAQNVLIRFQCSSGMSSTVTYCAISETTPGMKRVASTRALITLA